MTDFRMTRIGLIMEPRTDDPNEVEGVLNPAAMRGKDGQLYLFPRLVAHGNYSRIGIARVLFDEAGDPKGVERIGIALQPEADYELTETGGGCEDPRISYVAPLGQYVMTYTALSRLGPRIAMAVSHDLFTWRRLGLAVFRPYPDLPFDTVDDKDASFFPALVPDSLGRLALGLVHRPLFPGTRPEEKAGISETPVMNADRECVWISYCSIGPNAGVIAEGAQVGVFTSHRRVACPIEAWEHLKIGPGTPPVLCRHGWLILYHGVQTKLDMLSEPGKNCYSAGVMVLSREHPGTVLYRSKTPILTPEGPLESHGVVDEVVFPTGVDRRDDLGTPDRFDIYYGMADDRIGVARLDIPAVLPSGAVIGPS